MKKTFNTSADCKPRLHYMANIEQKLIKIKTMVDNGQYFTINKARQYGKTTTLKALGKLLSKEYVVISMDFQKEMSGAKFKDENTFSVAFANSFLWKINNSADLMSENFQSSIDNLKYAVQNQKESLELVELFRYLSAVCKTSEKPLVLIIDEIDSATDNQVFLDFLAQLRGYYIDRDETATFHSVILASVYDVKNIKQKFHPHEEHKVNSPWNIAADFLVDMSFSVEDIADMLKDYDADYHTNMDINKIACLIYDYTSGYPFLVSRLCKLIDERIAGSSKFPSKDSAWTKEGFLEAVKILLEEKNTLFESLIEKLDSYPELRTVLYSLLIIGKNIPYNPLHKPIEIAEMFGFIKNSGGSIAISNRIFETVLYNFFLSEELVTNKVYDASLKEKNQFIVNAHLDMKLVLEKFVVHFNDLYGDQDENFLEDAGRRFFLLYLKPIINGIGNYYIEAETRNRERTDVIVDYNGEQYIIEMKIWHGNSYNMRGEKQLSDYLDYYHLKRGYMLSFCFNKSKEIGVKEIILGDKILIEAIV